VQFDLFANPFAVLGLAGDTSVGVITARARELGTADAAAASRTLLIPRSRLQAELSFLPGASKYLADTCLEALKGQREPDLWPRLTLPARANLLAHLASRGAATGNQMRDLVGMQEAIRSSWDEMINQAREHARMPPVSGETSDSILEALVTQHAEAFADGMLALPKGADLFAEQLYNTSPDSMTRMNFLRQSAASWDRATSSDAEKYLGLAAPLEAILWDHPHAKSAEELAELVLLFANRTKPPREASRLVGLPHKPSANAVERWRAVALDLNNRQDAVLEAVIVLEALTKGFGTTDELGARTARDLDICRDRLASGEGTPEVRRLVAAIAAATEKELAFQRAAMGNGGTTAQTPAVVAELHDAFVAAARTARSDLPWRLLRAFMIRLHNEFSATEAVVSFTQLAIAHGAGKANASEVLRQLQLDLRTLRKEMLSAELATAIQLNQTSVARKLATELINLTDDAKERSNFQSTLRKLEQKQTTLKLKYGFGAVIAVIVLLLINTSNNNRPLAPYSVKGAQPRALPHFSLASIRRRGLSASCAAATRPFRTEPSTA
jgi:hypothetical protein